ncbi:hypothetical protein O1611_g7570 [Lasiodiplodia mahajangana]|uniref:Uncharacterized protein n=1 Tax=Lasiodiplodia mahajangana TaxID=1108764 RepID=A0ACC2JEY8_9PEZI|nr:hypothetical protein O1611_g7570 [Lasiodiplodia mahajangana]
MQRETEDKSDESAAYLHLTQPVVCFRCLLAASEWCHFGQIGGFKVQFANSSSRFIGMLLSDRQIPLTEEVDYEEFRAGITTVIASSLRISGSKVHVTTESELQEQNSGSGKEWRPNGDTGARIIAVHIWGGGHLHGIQFEIENGKRSPKWGKPGGDPSISLRIGAVREDGSSGHDFEGKLVHGEEKGESIEGVVGLKFVIRRSNSSRGDVPGLVMVQGLTRR